MQKKTNATIVPFVITGKYKRNGNLTCTFLEPFKIDKNQSIDEANNYLRNIMIKAIEKNT